jgi:signal transduction histidine kinase
MLDFIMLNRDLPAAQGEPPRVERMPARHALPPRSAAVGTPAAHDGALTHIRSVIAGLPESILLTDAHDRVELTNPAADALFDGRPVRDREDLLSRFETGGDPPATAERIGAADGTGTGPVQGPVTLRLRQQPNRWFSVESFPFERLDPDQAIPAGEGSVHVLRDVTDTRDLRSEREAFLAIMSHELRTPITTIYAGSSVLARNPELSPPASHMLAVDISAEAARLYDLVEDLIVIARLERRVLDPLDEPVLLQRVLDVTARVLSNRAPDVPFERDGITDPPPVRGDATYIEQAARDLALAAARVGGPGRPVTLRLDHEDASGEVVFSVLDRGPELSPAERGRVFDLPTETAIGRLAGIGVGPFVARQLVEAMGGRVWARNRHAGGVEMAFALPVDRG